MIQITFYSYTGKSNEIPKSLSDGITLNGLLRDNFNVLNPTLTVTNAGVFSFNYAYIPDFGKYYFVDGVTVTSATSYEISLRVDVLQTYKDNILASTATANAREDANKYASNRQNIYDVRPVLEKIDFTNAGLFNTDGSIIMVTIKGDK